MKSESKIIDLLNNKSSVKQEVYRLTKEHFGVFQQVLEEKVNRLRDCITNKAVTISYEESGDFDAKLKFSGDTLLFNMHTNIFDFESSHKIHKTKYIKDDKMRSFCGLINVYNFLSDSLKYNRLNDAGFLIARIFINKDGHFFVEGEDELGFLYNDFVKQKITRDAISAIIDSSMLFSLNFDLQIPKFNDVKVVSVNEVMSIDNRHKIKTAKRLGFKFSNETDD